MTLKIEILLILIIRLFFENAICFLDNSDFEVSTILPPDYSLNEWFLDLNNQYQKLNHYSALIAWDININSNSEYAEDAFSLGKLRSDWRNERCSQAMDFFNELKNADQKRMIYMLCRGPKYTNHQASELSEISDEIQQIYTETQICLPESFDICINYPRIWDFTFKKTPTNEIVLLNLSIATTPIVDDNHLHFYNLIESSNQEYYVFRGQEKTIENLENESKINKEIHNSKMFCLNIEPELENIMMGNFSSLRRNDCALPADFIFKWAWESWRLAVGPDISSKYPRAVELMNKGAQNNGYHDIGECWREELEMKDVRTILKNLWLEVKPFYELLHGVLRNALRKKYNGDNLVKATEPMPAHILGEMWSSDWTEYANLLLPFQEIDLDQNFRNTNWSSNDMVKRSEDFYASLGIKRMTKKFWSNSIFSKRAGNLTKCHGTAGNMFDGDDFRMVVCADTSIKDFYKIVHEMGHISYYMGSQDQPSMFQDAANSAFGEAIGDTIFLAMMTPQHLNRLSILPDKFLMANNLRKVNFQKRRIVHEIDPLFPYSNKSHIPRLKDIRLLGKFIPDFGQINEEMEKIDKFKEKFDETINEFDLSLLLRMGLSRIPQIPFEYILDLFRWDLFAGKINMDQANLYYWNLTKKEQGVVPPSDKIPVNEAIKRRKYLFDAAAKYHVADNTPYARYFLSSFLQVQIFKGLCEKTVFGTVNSHQKLPMQLHRCDIYGSRRAGRLLKKAMKLGSSTHWSNVLYILTGKYEITAEAFIEYYKPLINWLEKLVIEFEIPIGW